MNNLRKSFKGLFHVNHEAGMLRLFLAAVLIFILWSLLAILSASFDPLGNLEISNILGFKSQNLALSLFLDIFNAYFSIFSISFLILFVLVSFSSFDSIADFYSHIESHPSKRISKDYLSSCAFSIPKRKKLLFPDDFLNSSRVYADGPFDAVIKPGYALLLKNRADYSVRFNNRENSENFEISLAFREKLIDCFNLNPASFSFNVEDQTFAKSFLIEVAYAYDLPAGKESMGKFANVLALFDSGKIQRMIENILISETKIAISQYLRNSPGSSTSLFRLDLEEPIGKKENNSKERKLRKYSMVFNFYNKIHDQSIKRNRKRPVYLNTLAEVAALSKNHEENLFPSLKDQLNELLARSLQSTSLHLWGTNIIKAKIIRINEQGS